MQKQKNRKGLLLVLLLVATILTACNNSKDFTGTYKGVDEYNNAYEVEITKDKFNLLQANQLTSHDYEINDVVTNEGDYVNTTVEVKEQLTTGTYISFAQSHDDKDVYGLLVTRDGGITVNYAVMEKTSNGISIWKILVYALIGVGIVSIVQKHRKPLERTNKHGKE